MTLKKNSKTSTREMIGSSLLGLLIVAYAARTYFSDPTPSFFSLYNIGALLSPFVLYIMSIFITKTALKSILRVIAYILAIVVIFQYLLINVMFYQRII